MDGRFGARGDGRDDGVPFGGHFFVGLFLGWFMVVVDGALLLVLLALGLEMEMPSRVGTRKRNAKLWSLPLLLLAACFPTLRQWSLAAPRQPISGVPKPNLQKAAQSLRSVL